MEVKTDITFAISSSIVLHAVLNSLFNFPFNSLRKAHNSQQAELAKVEINNITKTRLRQASLAEICFIFDKYTLFFAIIAIADMNK